MGFGQELRLKTAAEFDRVFEKPGRSTNRCFTILCRPNQRLYPRLGLVISKRSAKHSVQRNRLKRLIRDSFRHSQETLSGLDVVVISKTSAALKTNQELTTLLAGQWVELQQCKES